MSDPRDIPTSVPTERVDALFGLARDDFTSSREALAKELRRAGHRQEAEWVKGLRKPTAAAWAVNQLARTQAQAANRLLEAGEELRGTHERVLAGEASASDLRRAAEQEGEAVRALLETAEGLLDRDGQSPSRPILEKAGQTLHAVALDEDTRAAFALGRLTRERQATGLGPVGEGIPATLAAPPQQPKKKRQPASEHRKRQAARENEKRAAEQRAKARATLKAANAELRARRGAVTKAEHELAQARQEADRTQRQLERATSQLEEARAAEADAQAAVTDSESAVENASESPGTR